jgi:hypothetical protein
MRVFYLLSLLCFVPLAKAELKWEKTVQEFQRVPDDKAVEARYGFRNTGAVPVTIKALRSSCGCTTAKLDRKTYGPGEVGEVVLRFTFGDRRGSYLKGVTVTTDDKSAEPVVLKLFVDIREPLTIAPAFVFWRTGDAATSKTIQLSAANNQEVRIKGVTSSNPRLTATLQTVQAGSQYAVAITPSSTAQKESAEIAVQTDFPADAPHTYLIHARVK